MLVDTNICVITAPDANHFRAAIYETIRHFVISSKKDV